MKTILIYVIAVSLAFTACSSEKAMAGGDDTLKIRIPDGVEINEVNSDRPPPLFKSLMESEYVVIATTRKLTPVGKRTKRKEFDMADWLVGIVNHFQVEELLFSQEAFIAGEPVSTNTMGTFETFRKLENSKDVYQEGNRYLLFLKQIPEGDEIFSTLELDRGKKYYRPYTSAQTIVLGDPDVMNGINNISKIDLSTGRFPELVDAIQQLSRALNSGSNQTRIANLKELTRSDNKIVRENAEYAIKTIRSRS